MSPFPVRVEVNASCEPSGEYSGRDSVAGCDTNKCACPPPAATVQISPPETNAISERSGESAGCVIDGSGAAKVARPEIAQKTVSKKQRRIVVDKKE
jgi:hypothetical protein